MINFLSVVLILSVCSDLYFVDSTSIKLPSTSTSKPGSPLVAEDASLRTGVSTTASSLSLGHFGVDGHPELDEKLQSAEFLGKQGPFAILYVHAAELINGAGYPQAFSSFMEALLSKGGKCKKVVIIIGGCKGDSSKMRKAEYGVKRLLREMAEGYGITFKEDLFSVSTHKDSDKNLVSDIQSFLDCTSSVSAASMYTYSGEIRQPVEEAREEDVVALSQVYAVADFFAARFNRAINTASSKWAPS